MPTSADVLLLSRASISPMPVKTAVAVTVIVVWSTALFLIANPRLERAPMIVSIPAEVVFHEPAVIAFNIILKYCTICCFLSTAE